MDALTDVYALGCLLFEALTGEPPFADSSGGAAMMAHVEAPPPSPLERRPDLPRGFDDVVRRAMAKEPAERYTSAGDLGQAALVAAGELRRAPSESVMATGAALPPELRQARPGVPRQAAPVEALAAPGAGDAGPEPERPAAPAGPLRWALPLVVLAILAVGMVVALGALSKL